MLIWVKITVDIYSIGTILKSVVHHFASKTDTRNDTKANQTEIKCGKPDVQQHSKSVDEALWDGYPRYVRIAAVRWADAVRGIPSGKA